MKKYSSGFSSRLMIFAGCCMASMAFTACVDKNYDFSDIDSTVAIPANNLTIPINIDAITLKDILKEGDRIKIVDGVYNILDEGSITSDPVIVRKFNIDAPNIPSSTKTVNLGIPSGVTPTGILSVPFTTQPSSFSFSSEDVPVNVCSIDDVKGLFVIDVTIRMPQVDNVISKVKLTDLKIQLPKAMMVNIVDGMNYDSSSGILTVRELVSSQGTAKLQVSATGIDISAYGNVYDYERHTFVLKSNIGILQANLVADTSDILPGATLPSSLDIISSYDISHLSVDSFSGEIIYTLEDFDIPEVNLSDLPGLLSQEGTDIRIVNPQIYLQFNNPLQQFGLYAETGVEIVAVRNGVPSKSFTLDNPVFTICKGNPSDGLYNYCLAPTKPTNPEPGFPNAEFVGFKHLSDILSGEGLPQALRFTVNKPQVPRHYVKDFKLGYDYGNIHGKYRFVAPLAMEVGSIIHYSETFDGWGSDDLDDLTITSLSVVADITNQLPCDLKFTGTPIDRNGKPMQNVTITGAELKGNTTGQKLDIKVEGTIKNLDGMRFDAVCTSTSPEALSDDMKIEMKNIRVTVSAYYTKEL